MNRWQRTIVVIVASVLSIGLAGCSRDKTAADPLSLDYVDIEKNAAQTEVAFYMWGGSDAINSWIDGYVAEALRTRYDIELKRVPMDASVFVSKLLTEKQAGKEKGVIDLLWINGENFKNARKADLLYGPFLDKLPSYNDFIDSAAAQMDAGFPIQGYEAPYGKAQFNLEYYSDRIPDPPDTFAKLLDWAKANPGVFTYPQPPDFTGSAFVRQAFYAVTGGHEQYMDGFVQSLFDRNAPALWSYLNEIEPYLWQEGGNYPKDLATLDALFERGEVLINMSYTQTRASTRIAEGRYGKSVRSFVLKDGSLYNTHFVAIPFNAPNKAGALVAANFLMSPEAQYSKNIPANWGDFTVLSLDRLSSEDRGKFTSLDLGAATVSLADLDKYAVPEIPSEYFVALEKGWEEHVLKK